MLTKASAFESRPVRKNAPRNWGIFYFSIIKLVVIVMAYWVYILYSERCDRYYIGQTSDFAERLARHNAGKEKATAPFAPWIIFWKARKSSRSEAMILEKKLKNLSRDRLKRFMEKYK